MFATGRKISHFPAGSASHRPAGTVSPLLIRARQRARAGQGARITQIKVARIPAPGIFSLPRAGRCVVLNWRSKAVSPVPAGRAADALWRPRQFRLFDLCQTKHPALLVGGCRSAPLLAVRIVRKGRTAFQGCALTEIQRKA